MVADYDHLVFAFLVISWASSYLMLLFYFVVLSKRQNNNLFSSLAATKHQPANMPKRDGRNQNVFVMHSCLNFANIKLLKFRTIEEFAISKNGQIIANIKL
jgi:hypothetical protein